MIDEIRDRKIDNMKKAARIFCIHAIGLINEVRRLRKDDSLESFDIIKDLRNVKQKIENYIGSNDD